jgi:hypothetical protein
VVLKIRHHSSGETTLQVKEYLSPPSNAESSAKFEDRQPSPFFMTRPLRDSDVKLLTSGQIVKDHATLLFEIE